VPEDYIHRIGRTGRAGAEGEAISFCAPEEEKMLAEIEKLLKRKISVVRADALPVTASPRHHAHAGSSHAGHGHAGAAHGGRGHAGHARPQGESRSHAEHSRAHGEQSRSHAAQHVPRAAQHPAPDRHLEQPRAHQAQRTHAPAALTAPSTHTPSRHGQRKPKPIPALLMKRRVTEPESA
jgi:ATP-dependent RNA helicase RhlE